MLEHGTRIIAALVGKRTYAPKRVRFEGAVICDKSSENIGHRDKIRLSPRYGNGILYYRRHPDVNLRRDLMRVATIMLACAEVLLRQQ